VERQIGSLQVLVKQFLPNSPRASIILPDLTDAGVARDRNGACLSGGLRSLGSLTVMWINMAIAFDPKVAAAYYNRGLVLIAKGDIDRAITDLNTAIEINPPYAEAYRGRGDIPGRSLTTTGVAPSGRRDTLPKQSQTSTRQSRSILIMLSPMRIGD